MFDSLSDRLTGVFRKFSGTGRLDEANIQDGLREVRLALLEADVNFKVVRDFIERVRERCLGQDVLKSLTPAQQVVKIVHDELVELLGGGATQLDLRGKQPYVIMMVGLQGSGKTTSSAKLANLLRKQKMRPYLAPADVYRPAAIDQLHTLAKQLDIPAYPSATGMNPVDIAAAAVEDAREKQCNVVIVDTAGRLHIDETLMQELVSIKGRVEPQEILFVADAMTGQDAVTVAEAFNAALDISGVVLTKMDGDARGGAALSIRSVTGKPVKFVGMGEKLSDIEVFHPDRVAGRILGMGDMMTLIEKAQSTIKAEEAEELGRKFQKAEFDLEDFRTQMRRLKKLGSLEGLLKLIPGMGALREKLGEMNVPEKEMGRVEAIISSMTMQERRNPKVLNGSRRQRIARGSGTTVQDVNQLIKNFEQMRDMMKKVMGGGKPAPAGKMPRMPKLPGMGGLGAMGAMGGMGGLGGLGGMPGMPGMPGAGDGEAAPGGPNPMSKTALKKKKQLRKQQRNKSKKR